MREEMETEREKKKRREIEAESLEVEKIIELKKAEEIERSYRYLGKERV